MGGSVWSDVKDLEMESSGGSTTMLIFLMPLNCTLQNDDNGKLNVIYILQQ